MNFLKSNLKSILTAERELSEAIESFGWECVKESGNAKVDFLIQTENVRSVVEIKLITDQSEKRFEQIKDRAFNQINECIKDLGIDKGILIINDKIYVVSKVDFYRINFFPTPKELKKERIIDKPNKSTSMLFIRCIVRGAINETINNRKIQKLSLENTKIKNENLKLKKAVESLEKQVEFVRRLDIEEEIKFNSLIELSNKIFDKSSNIQELEIEMNKFINRPELLTNQSREFIFESLNHYKHVISDYSSYVLFLSKSLEKEILAKFFQSCHKIIRQEVQDIQSYKIKDRSNRQTLMIYLKFLKADSKEPFLSLDQMRYIFKITLSESEEEILLISREVFYKIFHPFDLFQDDGLLEQIKNIRNEGAHIKPINKELADKFKVNFIEAINILLDSIK